MMHDHRFIVRSDGNGVALSLSPAQSTEILPINFSSNGSFLSGLLLTPALHLSSAASDFVADSVVNGRYAELYSALKTMVDLDEDESMAIDAETYRLASSVLARLAYEKISPPKVFAHGGDAVVYTWYQQDASFQLTVSGGLAVLKKRSEGQGATKLGHAELSQGIGNLIPHLRFKNFGNTSSAAA